MIFDTEENGWTRISGSLGWRKSLRDKHWAQVSRSRLGWQWVILRADPDTMCPVAVADGEDISLRAVKEDVDHWNDNYHRHVLAFHPQSSGIWSYRCRLCGGDGGASSPDALIALGSKYHAECEAAWQRGER